MANRPASVKQSDVTRAVKGALAAGVPVERVEVDQRTGRIVVYCQGGAEAAVNEWDEVLK